MEFEQTSIEGVVLVHQSCFRDARGSFTKTIHADEFADAGLRHDFREQYCSTSVPGVVRGLHFQLPPADHAKYVYALSGEVLDVAVDVRAGSPTYGSHVRVVLRPGHAGIYIPHGFAHGFAVLGDEPAVLVYNVTSVHSPEHDSGIRFGSAGIDWPTSEPILSDRDMLLPALADFEPPSEWRYP